MGNIYFLNKIDGQKSNGILNLRKIYSLKDLNLNFTFLYYLENQNYYSKIYKPSLSVKSKILVIVNLKDTSSKTQINIVN